MGVNRVGVAVIGCGRIASAHLPAIRDIAEFERVATVDAVPERAEKAAKEFGFARWFTSVDQVLELPEVQAVVVLLPHKDHCPVSIKALRAGKHVLVEKPIALDTAEADQMIAAAEQAGCKLMVAHVIRFMWAQRRARHLLAEGAIGQPLHLIERRLESVATPATGWWASRDQTGGLMWMLNGSHSVDTALWMLNTEAERVYAEFGHHNPAWEGEDDFSATLALSNGVIAGLHQSFNSRISTLDAIIIGREATIETHGFGELTLHSARGQERQVPSQRENAYMLQDREFALAILENREPIASGKDVRKVMQVLDAGRVSAQEHRMVTIQRNG